MSNTDSVSRVGGYHAQYELRDPSGKLVAIFTEVNDAGVCAKAIANATAEARISAIDECIAACRGETDALSWARRKLEALKGSKQ